MLRTAASSGKNGAALVLVMGSLVLLSVLIISFILSVRTELVTAKNSVANEGTRQLADSTVNFVIAQIKDATSTPNLAWASQPGMIRTYDTSGTASGCFKLYSSNLMRVSGGFNASSEAASLANWSSSPALFVDLNEPQSIDGTDIYPILDGNNLITSNGKQTYSTLVDGFYLENTPGATTSQKVPMPVQWLYVLKNGATLAPSSGNGKVATFSGSNIPTQTNPIIGRIAFWTDDETSKININTASDGVFWDTPRTEGATERSYATAQPATREYQRFPGLPATTSLRTVFSTLSSAQIYALVPRISDDGANPTGAPSPGGVRNDKDRLFASTDELLFKPTFDSNKRDYNPLTKADLQRAKFFITAYNRAPEVNLFNRPRVTIWPIHSSLATNSNSAYVTTTDKLIAFCSTMRTDLPASQQYRYYFQRQDPNSATTDINLTRNKELYKYLQYLTERPIPGFGGHFKAKLGDDRDQLLTEIFDYIRTVNLEDSQLGGSARTAKSFAPDRDVGYNNSTPVQTPGGNGPQGLVVPTEAEFTNGNNTRGFGRFSTVSGAFIWFIGVADYTHTRDGKTVNPPVETNPAVVPTNPNHIRVQALIGLDWFNPALGYAPPKTGFTFQLKGQELFECGSSSASLQNMGFQATQPGTIWQGFNYPGGRQGHILPLSGLTATETVSGTNYSIYTGYNKKAYPYLSQPIDLDKTTGTFFFKGGDLTISVRFNNVEIQTITLNFPPATLPLPTLAPAQVSQTGKPTRNFRYFFLSAANTVSGPFGGRFTDDSTSAFMSDGDVLQEIIATSGDMRIIAGRRKIEKADALFKPHARYGATAFAHSLWGEAQSPFYRATAGQLAPGVNYGTYDDTWPSGPTSAAPTSLATNIESKTGVVVGKSTPWQAGEVPGDWDNGISNLSDGPYINKPDEGNIKSTGTNPPYFVASYNFDIDTTNSSYFSPNRQISSAGMFGSLPTGVRRNMPWQTLLFRPTPARHPGLGSPVSGPPFTTPPDHLIMDLFHMPVVEPYAVSEPFSTAGKINLNYQIVPFTYIHRETAIRAVLYPEKMMLIPNGDAATYKIAGKGGSYRYDINLDETLRGNGTTGGIEDRFRNNDLYRSATEICSIALVPKLSGATYASMSSSSPDFWGNYRVTGDNTRERPYANLYGRLTTKSNVYTVHYRVQTLKKASNTPQAVWNESQDQVAGELRGSSTIERYIDPNDKNLPDFVTNNDETVEKYYRFRVNSTKQFGK